MYLTSLVEKLKAEHIVAFLEGSDAFLSLLNETGSVVLSTTANVNVAKCALTGNIVSSHILTCTGR